MCELWFRCVVVRLEEEHMQRLMTFSCRVGGKPEVNGMQAGNGSENDG